MAGEKEVLAGKFGSAEELVKAYKELESAFTKKSQELSALKCGGAAVAGGSVAADKASETVVGVETAVSHDSDVEDTDVVVADDIGEDFGGNGVIADDGLATAVEGVSDEDVVEDKPISDTAGVECLCDGEGKDVDPLDVEVVDLGGEGEPAEEGSVATEDNDSGKALDGEAISAVAPADLSGEIDKFFADNAHAARYAEQIGERVKGAPEYNALLKAYNEVLGLELERLANPTVQALLNMVSNNAEVTEGVLRRYFEGLKSNMPPVTIKGGYGAVTVTPPSRPKTLGDAAGMAISLLKK